MFIVWDKKYKIIIRKKTKTRTKTFDFKETLDEEERTVTGTDLANLVGSYCSDNNFQSIYVLNDIIHISCITDSKTRSGYTIDIEIKQIII